jgi:hypothetical protein
MATVKIVGKAFVTFKGLTDKASVWRQVGIVCGFAGRVNICDPDESM